MRTGVVLLTMIASLNLVAGSAQNNGVMSKIVQAEQVLKQHPRDQNAWQQLYTLINENYVKLTAGQRSDIRKVLEEYGVWSTGTLYTSNEPGTKIIVKGRVINAQGKPMANASLHIFQTDSHGYYTPLDSAEKKMGEPDARLFCFLKTDANGNFEIHTVRPASYPIKYDGRTIPQHIHNNITAKGYTSKYLQMVFDDDPVMNDYWRQWATSNGFPVLKLNNETPQRIATVEIRLTR
jgi:protocatechuate 3,4-dioxygenase beta subunit